jgi:rsbT co-antagonist protein RsbR
VTANPTTSAELHQELEALRRRTIDLERQLVERHQPSTDDIFFTRALDLLSIVGFDGYFKKINPAWSKQLGYTDAELFAQPFIAFVHPDDIERTLVEAERLNTGKGVTIAFENRYRHKDGSYRNLLWTCASDTASQLIYSITLDITDRKRIEQERNLYAEVVRNMPTGLAVQRLEQLDDPSSLTLVLTNEAADQLSSGGLAQQVGQRLVDAYPEMAGHPLLQQYARVVTSGRPFAIENEFQSEAGSVFFSILVFPLPDQHIGIMHENITSRKQAEDALRQSIMQEEIIRAQKATLEELSTPLIPISDKIVVMPLIGSVDSRRAQQVIETLLHGISTTRAEIAILDITGVSVVDTQVANGFIRAAQAVKLLGAQVLLTGIRPEVAQTLIGLGVDLSGIVTCSSLQNGIALAIKRQ